VKSPPLPFVAAMDLEIELPRTGPTDIELADEDLEHVVGGLQRTWLPTAAEPRLPGRPEL